MKNKEQYACMLVRELPAQAISRMRPALRDQALVLLDGEPPLQTVVSLNTKARLLGIRHGMTRSEVQTYGVRCVSRSASSEAAAKATLIECASSYSPRIEVRDEDRDFLCCLDVTGTEALFGPAEQLAKSLRLRCASMGISAQIVVSNDFHTSILLARALRAKHGVQVVRQDQETTTALAALPLSVLNLSQDHAATFSLWGIRTLGMLASLPETQLIARLGHEGKKLHQLARGALPHLFQPIDIPFILEEQAELEDPLDNLESLLFGVAIMLEHLIMRASLRIYALASITIELTLENNEIHRRTISPRVPTNDRHLWLKLLRLDLEAHPAMAPIINIQVRADPGKTSKVQLGLFSPQLPEPGRLDVMVAKIAAIVGENNIGSPVLEDIHNADGFHLESFRVPPTLCSNKVPVQQRRTCLRRVLPPFATTMKLESGKPKYFLFREHKYHVEHTYGPWLVGGEWWSERIWGQEQWDLIARGANDGILFCCVIRDFISGLWHVAGLYD